MARPSTKAAYWAEIIRRYRLSGLTQSLFCQENDISFHSLRWWLHQLRAKQAIRNLDGKTRLTNPRPQPPALPPPEPPRFLPVRLIETDANSELPDLLRDEHPEIQVLLRGGRRVAVGPGFDPDLLRRVVTALEVTGC